MDEIINIIDTLLLLTGKNKGEIDKFLKQHNDALSKIDLEKTDIEHYIEFSKLNAYDGWKAYSMLQDVLLRRRKIKIHNSIFNCICRNSNTIVAIDKIRGEIDTIVQRNYTYTPRILTNLDYSKKHY